MSRAVSNLVIVLAMATIVTAILALSSNTARVEDPAGGQSGDSTPTAAETATGIDPAETFGGRTADALKDTTEASDETPETPAYLDPEPIDGTADGRTTLEDDAAVLGVTVAQGSSSAEQLADTGPIEIGQWLVIATSIMAVGGLARNAGRDHAEGLLTVLP